MAEKYIIIDDIVDTGTTLRYILETIEHNYARIIGKYNPSRPGPRCTGCLLWNGGDDSYWRAKGILEDSVPVHTFEL